MPLVAKADIAGSFGIIREGSRIPKSVPKELLNQWKAADPPIVVDSKSKDAPPILTDDAPPDEYAD